MARWGLLGAVLAFGAACAEPEAPTVLVAASLARVAPEIFGPDVRLSYAPTSTLARQVEQGITADVLLSADEAWVDALRAKGFGVEALQFARNELVAWVRTGRPAPRTPAELARFDRIAVGAETVPVGRYAREALAGLDLGDRLLPCRSAPAVLAALEAGEAEVGLAYATDGRGEPGLEVAFRFEAPRPGYWALLLRDRPEARRLWEALRSERAAAALQRHGFLPAP